MNVPFLDLAYSNRELREDILARWEAILDTGRFNGGPAVTDCEEAMATAFGADHFALVSSGTDALRFALLSLGIRPGDEVITVPNTFIATTEAITQCGARPVFVDIHPETYTMDPDAVADALTPRTKVLLPVHLYGHPTGMDPLLDFAEEHGLTIVEDCAQAHGARYKGRTVGTFGAAAAYSFYPGKNLGACGEAGGVATNDATLDRQIRIYRDHGQARKYFHEVAGYNGRCDALQAAALSVKLPHLDAWREARARLAARYNERLRDIPDLRCPETAPWATHAWHLYVIQVEQRDRLAAALAEAGIGTGMHYPVPLHLQEAHADLGYQRGDFPVAETMADRLLSLPLYPGLSNEAVKYVAETVAKQYASLC